MVVLVIVVVGCFIAGMWAATTWLPPLAEGSVGAMAYFVVCGLAGAVLVILGVHIWELVRELGESGRLIGASQIVADELDSMFWESGSLAALALIGYLLAPKTARHQPS